MTMTKGNTNTTTTNTAAFHFVSINGIPFLEETSNPTISIWDTSFHRGDGVFEVMRLLSSGQIRSLDSHLKRLETSATAVGCPLPHRDTLREWLKQAALAVKDASTPSVSKPESTSLSLPALVDGSAPGSLRLIATKGGGPGLHEHVVPNIIISWSPLPKWPQSFTLYPLVAPWHCAGAPGWETPIKWTSYGPNVVSTQKAKANGYSDALLLSSLRLSDSFAPNLEDCHVLDGPNFALSWIRDNTLYLPDTDALGLLPSITQDLVRQIAEETLGMTVERGLYTLQDLFAANEVYVTSTTRGIIPVSAIGSHTYSSDIPRIRQLQEKLECVVNSETSMV